MSDYDNTNRGAIFENSRKETDKHPDMTGKLNVDGVDRWFSAWWKTSQSGQQYLSMSLGKPCDEQQQQQPQRPPQRPQGNRPPPQQGYGNRRG